MTPRHPTSLIAESILADSAPRTFPGRASNHDTPPAPAAPPQEPAAKEGSPRYRVGCAGMFMLGTDWGCRDEDEAIAACLDGPPGCEVLDTQTGQWIGPTCLEEAQEARARIEARKDRIEHRILAILPEHGSDTWPTQAEIASALGEPVTLIDSMVYWLHERGRVVHDGQWPTRWARAENGGER